LWIVPIATLVPALTLCALRAYRPGEVVALADSLGGGRGLLLTLFEQADPEWMTSRQAEQAAAFTLPRLKLRRAWLLVPAAAFLAVALLMPQRVVGRQANTALAEQIAASLNSAVIELKKQDLITPEEEQQLKEEIEQIKRGAEKRVDASSWEAADALREKVNAGLAEKQQAIKWAQDSLARMAAAGQVTGDGSGTAASAELKQALAKLAENGMLAGAPPELQALLKGGKLPASAAELSALSASLAQYLGEMNGRFGEFAGMTADYGHFDASEFAAADSAAANGTPGRGGIDDGRADAELTYGQETQKADKFKSHPLPPGAPRSPDDWAPAVVLPGAPQEMPTLSSAAAARQYSAAPGQAAWRRSLAPRHQSAVKKYFGGSSNSTGGSGRGGGW
jgi:hypothetical protein